MIELLVVIGIAALLAGLLLATLARSRKSAQAAVCMSNQRQIHTAMVNYLVSERVLPKLTKQFDASPPFQTAAQLTVPYWLTPAVWHANATESLFVNFGRYWEARLLDSPEVFFCPTQTHPEFQFATEVNRWPPDPVSAPQAGLEFHFWNDVFSSYTRRLGLSYIRFDDVHPGTAITADVCERPDLKATNHDGSAFNYATADGAVSAVEDRWYLDESTISSVSSLPQMSQHYLKAFRRLDRAGVTDEWWK